MLKLSLESDFDRRTVSEDNSLLLANLAALTNLRELWLREGLNVNGPIPEELGALSKLTIFRSSHNNFTGDIPASFLNLKNLRSLILENNQMAITLPGPLADLPHLKLVRLDGNRVSGCITEEMAERHLNEVAEICP